MRTIQVDPIDWPRCAKCHMPVENFSVVVTDNSTNFVAVCHGETESAMIEDETWDSVLGTPYVNFGSAFEGEQNVD